MAVIRRRIDNDIEQKIITGIITSDSFCRQLIPIIKKEYFSVESAAIVFDWCKKYFHSYGAAPKQYIEDVYKESKDNFNEDQQEILNTFLTNISKQYEQNTSFNVDYILDQATRYMRKQALELTTDKVRKLLDSGRIDKAEQEISGYKKVMKDLSEWVNPLDPVFIRDVIYSEMENEDRLFTFPGALGRMAGWFERGTLVAVLAPMKRGKSFMLQEMAIHGILNRKRVVFISLEMRSKRIGRRIIKRITARKDTDGDFPFPCFDCKKNQDGTCTKKERTNKVKLLDENEKKPKFDKNLKYRPCTECRGDFTFSVATWFTLKHKDKMTVKGAVGKARGLKSMYGDNFRMVSYPSYAANLSDIRNSIQKLEFAENFIPDIIIVDYADILKPEDGRLTDRRERLDETWKMLKNLADERACLVITASQSTRKSIDKRSVSQTDVAEDIRKLAHVDMMFALNQTAEEKREGVMRVGVLAHREDEFDLGTECIILQQRALGQTLLDSEILYSNEKTTEEYNELFD
jgi:replicative DNA helicase